MYHIVRKSWSSLIVLGIFLLAACTPRVQSAAGTLVAPVGATLQSRLLTRAASGMQTSVVELPTLVIEAGKTGVAAAGTKAPEYLTPERPTTGYQIHPEDIIIFQAEKPIKVHEAAYRFSTFPSYLIQVNQAKYPSITDQESVLNPGWIIIIFLGSSQRVDLIPYTQEAWNNIPGCGGRPASETDRITCGEITLDFTSESGRLRPECMPNTLAGEYQVKSRYQGSILYLDGTPFLYGVYYDAAQKTILMGPAIVHNKSNVLQCG